MSEDYPPADEYDPTAPDWWATSITADQLDAIEYPPMRYLHRETGFPRGGVTLLAGAPKSGKSYMALGLALAVAEKGHPFGSSEAVDESGHALALMLDDNSRRRVQSRLRNVAGNRPLPPGLTVHTDRNFGFGPEAAANLAVYLKVHRGTALVVVDTLEHIRADRSHADSSYRADVKALGHIREVSAAYPETSFLCLVHTRKGEDEDPLEAVSGTHGVSGGADAVLVLSGKRGTGKRRLDIISRDDGDRSLVLALGSNGLTITADDPDDPSVHMSPDQARVYRAMRECDTPVSARDLGPMVPGIAKLGNLLGKLAKEGHVRRTERGYYEVTT